MTLKEVSRDMLTVLGHMWAAPVTLVGLMYVLTFTALGWYSWDSKQGNTLLFNTADMPAWLVKRWQGWGGQTIGHVVVMSETDVRRREIILRHEQEHVKQIMRLGVFQPVLYLVVMLTIKLGCSNIEPYKHNIFEIDARKAAGQPVDY